MPPVRARFEGQSPGHATPRNLQRSISSRHPQQQFNAKRQTLER